MPCRGFTATRGSVATPPEPGRLRHVGRIVDPLVREDGEPEPELTLEPTPGGSPAEASADASTGSRLDERHSPETTDVSPGDGAPLVRGGQMRDRLLSRAHERRAISR